MRKAKLFITAIAALVARARLAWLQRSEGLRERGVVRLANIAEAQYATGNITKLVDAAVTERWLLCKIGSDSAHVAVCGASDTPLGVITDEAEAQHDEINVFLLPPGVGTILMVASAAILQGALLEPAANGRVATLGGGVGTHHVVGRALTAASAAGDVIEVAPMYFLRVI